MDNSDTRGGSPISFLKPTHNSDKGRGSVMQTKLYEIIREWPEWTM